MLPSQILTWRIGAPEEQAWIYARPGLFDRLEVAVIVANGAVVSANVEYDDATIYSTEPAARAQRGQRLDTLLE